MGKGERKTIVFATLGMAFWWPMLRNSVVGFIFSPSTVGEIQSQIELWVFIATAVVLSLGFAFASAKGAKRRLTSNAFPMASCFAASTLSLVVFLFSGTPHIGILIADSIALACAYVVLPFAWGSILIREMGASPKRLLLVLAASYTVSFFIGYLSYLPSPFDLIRPIGAPALSALAWYACSRQVSAKTPSCNQASGNSRKGGSLYVLVLVLFLVSSIATGFINLGSVSYQPSFDTLIRDTLNIGVTASLLVIIGLSKHMERIKFSLIVVLAVVLFGGIFIATIFQQSWFFAGTGLMQTSKSCFSLLLYMLVLIEAAPKTNPEATILIRFVLPTAASSFISYLAVPFCASLFSVSYSDFWGLLSLLMGFLLGVFLFGFLSSIVVKYLPRSEQADAGGSEAAVVATMMKGEYGLTDKETEVLTLLLEGNTYKRIASLLYVSDSTVQSHAKSIYRKANVHTKQDLVDRAASMRDEIL